MQAVGDYLKTLFCVVLDNLASIIHTIATLIWSL